MIQIGNLIIMLKKEQDKELANQYIKGYEEGHKSGRLEKIVSSNTINEIREALGFKRIDKS